MSIEIWKDIKGFEGSYKISNLGRVKSYFKSGKILKPKIDKDGYHEYGLWCNKQFKNIYRRAHRLVAEAFLDNTDNHPVINHIDCDKSNNRVDNLEWCSFVHNTVHGYKNNPEKRIGKGFSDMEYSELNRAVDLYKSGYTYQQLNDLFGLETARSLWSDILKGRRYSEITGITESILRDDPHPTTKINKNIVEDILTSVHINKVPQSILCKKYGLSPAQVSRIVNGTRWEESYKEFMERNIGRIKS